MVFQQSDPSYSAQLVHFAQDLYAAGARNRATYIHALQYPCAENGTQSQDNPVEDKLQFSLANEVFQGVMIDTFNSTSYLDDLAWAAAWLYRATGEADYAAAAFRYVLNVLTERSIHYSRAIMSTVSLYCRCITLVV